MNKEWNISISEPKGDIISQILNSRNVKDPVHFLKPRKEDFLPFEELSNIKEAANIVLSAIENGRRIHVLGDP